MIVFKKPLPVYIPYEENYLSRISRGEREVPNHGILTQQRCFHQNPVYFNKTVLSLIEYSTDLLINQCWYGIGLNPHVPPAVVGLGHSLLNTLKAAKHSDSHLYAKVYEHNENNTYNKHTYIYRKYNQILKRELLEVWKFPIKIFDKILDHWSQEFWNKFFFKFLNRLDFGILNPPKKNYQIR